MKGTNRTSSMAGASSTRKQKLYVTLERIHCGAQRTHYPCNAAGMRWLRCRVYPAVSSKRWHRVFDSSEHSNTASAPASYEQTVGDTQLSFPGLLATAIRFPPPSVQWNLASGVRYLGIRGSWKGPLRGCGSCRYAYYGCSGCLTLSRLIKTNTPQRDPRVTVAVNPQK
jgi:hypothetical protein